MQIRLDAYLRSLGLGFELERMTVFVSRTSVRIFCNIIMGLSCLGMLEMQGYYVCIQ